MVFTHPTSVLKVESHKFICATNSDLIKIPGSNTTTFTIEKVTKIKLVLMSNLTIFHKQKTAGGVAAAPFARHCQYFLIEANFVLSFLS